MKIKAVSHDNRRRTFTISTRRGELSIPYVKADPAPTPADPIVECFVDPELGREAITWRLRSGAEGSLHGDAFLDFNADPVFIAEVELHRLTLAARAAFEASGLSTRRVAAALHTSVPQLYRLLDPTNYTKSARQLLALLAVLGIEVDAVPRRTA